MWLWLPQQRKQQQPRLFSICLLAAALVFLMGHARIHTANLLQMEQRNLRHPPPPTKFGFEQNPPLRYWTLMTNTHNDEDDIAKSSYPWRLSSHPQNNVVVHKYTKDPTFASLCTQTILKDSMYDVLLLELAPNSNKNAWELLAHRLRQRFPNVMIIFVDVSSSLPPNNKDYDQWKTHLVEQVQGYSFQLLQDSKNDNTIHNKDWWVSSTNNNNNNNSTKQLSWKGHERVANGIRGLVQQRHSPQLLVQNHPNRNTLGTWGTGDQCQLFDNKDNNNNNNNKSLQHRPLEVSNEKVTTISMENPFDQPRMVYLTYATHPWSHYNRKLYPKVKVQLQEKPSVVLDPYHSSSLDNHYGRHAMIRTSAIGKLPPGRSSKITVSVLEEYTIAPFRIVGISILPAEMERHQYNIDLDGFIVNSPMIIETTSWLEEESEEDVSEEEEE